MFMTKCQRIAPAVLALMVLASCATAHEASVRKRPLVTAHRGGALLLPENTLPAMRRALELGVDMLEFDMQLTEDGEVIVTHDVEVNPEFCEASPESGVKPGAVPLMTLAQLKQFDCGSRHRAIYPTQQAVPGTRMPTFAELLEATRNGNASFFGETKMPGADSGIRVDPERFVRKVDAIIREYGVEDRFILQSFDWRTLDAMHRINPRIRTCLLFPKATSRPDYLATVREHHGGCMLMRPDFADAAEVKKLRDAGILVFSDVVDDEAGWKSYIGMGVDAVFTNDPAGLIQYLKKSGLRD